MKLRALLAVVAVACGDDASDAIEGTGTVEYAAVDVAPLVGGRVVSVLVEEGDAVRQGQAVATLTNVATASDVDARRAAVDRAEHQLRDFEAGARPLEIARALADVRAAEADAATVERDASRAAALFRGGAISRQEMEVAQARATVASSRAAAARAALQLVREGTRPERVQTARADVAAARAALDAARRSEGELTLEAPVRGTVAVQVVDPGEIVLAGAPVVTIARADSLWVRIFLNQEDFARVRRGDAATARLDDLPERAFSGRVVALADRAEFTPRVALTERERADLLFGVKVLLHDRSGTLKAGLPVTVRIAPRR